MVRQNNAMLAINTGNNDMNVKPLETFEGFLRDACKHGWHVTLVPSAYDGRDIRFYAHPQNDEGLTVDFAIRENTAVALPWAAETHAPVPVEAEPLVMWLDVGDTVLDERRQPRNPAYDTLEQLMDAVGLLEPTPVQRVVTERVTWVVNTLSDGGGFDQASFGDEASARAFCLAQHGAASPN